MVSNNVRDSSIQVSNEFSSNKNTKNKAPQDNKGQKQASANEAMPGQYLSVKRKITYQIHGDD